MSEKSKIIVIVGPTASGKSDLAVMLAKKFDGEVISADSRQVYRDMDIGTGKITKKEMRGVPHHLLDVASPGGVFTVADYKKKAGVVLREILHRKKLPIVCGGTGFYISALVDGLELPEAPPNTVLRKRLARMKTEELFAELKKLDPVFAKKIDAKNPVRLIRAIEIARALGHVPPLRRNTPYDALFIGIQIPLEELRKRIHQRLLGRMKSGMMNEMRTLRKKGLSLKRMEALGLEYRYGARYLAGKLSEEKMVAELEIAIVQYAKRQMTWFKRNKHIHWVGLKQKVKIEGLVKNFLLYSQDEG